MRNPDHWQPPEREPDRAPTTRRAAVLGLVMIVLLILGGLLLTHILGGMTRLQDCALSGRSNCASGLERNAHGIDVRDVFAAASTAWRLT